ncbi:MAG: YggT family protein [Coriobacteriales bacterium]|jgi:YggT family protein|nr:YggT family protein [Coriobacteriales bacterium]
MIAVILGSLLNLYSLLVFIWALMSWFDHSRGFLNDAYTVLNSLVEPYVKIFRRFIPPMGGMDFSAFVALIVLQIVGQALVRFLA